jgi:hypothetical protein
VSAASESNKRSDSSAVRSAAAASTNGRRMKRCVSPSSLRGQAACRVTCRRNRPFAAPRLHDNRLTDIIAPIVTLLLMTRRPLTPFSPSFPLNSIITISPLPFRTRVAFTSQTNPSCTQAALLISLRLAGTQSSSSAQLYTSKVGTQRFGRPTLEAKIEPLFLHRACSLRNQRFVSVSRAPRDDYPNNHPSVPD